MMRKTPKPRPAPFSPALPGGKKNPYRGPAMASDPRDDSSGIGGVPKRPGRASSTTYEPPKKVKRKFPTTVPKMGK